MSYKQAVEVRRLLTRYFELGAQFHHGGCKGADVEAADVAQELGYWVVRHPGPEGGPWEDEESEADDEERAPKGHFARNRDIVHECDVVIATPAQGTDAPESLRRGGTWYTIEYARKRNVPLDLINPDGTVSK